MVLRNRPTLIIGTERLACLNSPLACSGGPSPSTRQVPGSSPGSGGRAARAFFIHPPFLPPSRIVKGTMNLVIFFFSNALLGVLSIKMFYVGGYSITGIAHYLLYQLQIYRYYVLPKRNVCNNIKSPFISHVNCIIICVDLLRGLFSTIFIHTCIYVLILFQTL